MSTKSLVHLYWIQNKVRPLTLDTIQLKMCGHDETKFQSHDVKEYCLLSKNKDFPDVICWRGLIRIFSNGRKHYLRCALHRDNLEKFKEDIEILRNKYSTKYLGSMLGYLQPRVTSFTSI